MFILFMVLINGSSFCNSQNGKFSYGYASSQGKRNSMEDFYETTVAGVDGETVGLFGVFDGKYKQVITHKFRITSILCRMSDLWPIKQGVLGMILLPLDVEKNITRSCEQISSPL